MIIFETQLKKLKHEVLREIAILAKDDKLTQQEFEKIPYKIIQGDKPQYRCCVYKERAIVSERAKLAGGFLPDGDSTDELVDIQKDGQIIYVIEAACDRCPINKFTVTEACRGCIAHKCMEACPANAVTKIAGRAYINQEQCKECGMCKKACPYNAISEVMRPCKKVCPTDALDVNQEDRRAIINKDECISCGACMAACPFGAISDKSYIVPVIRALNKQKRVYAVVAPAIAGQFGPKTSVGQIKQAFLKLGFQDMMEAACGADAVTVHESLEFIERMENGDKYMANSCCPGFMKYIEKKMPDQAARISGTVSPMVATARYIKQKDKGAVVVFIGPCTAKKSEARRKSIRDAVDYVLTFEEVAALMSAYNIDPEMEQEISVEDASTYGRGFAQSGGLTAAIENFIRDKKEHREFKPVEVKNQDRVKRAVKRANVGIPDVRIQESAVFMKEKELGVQFKPIKVSGAEEIIKTMRLAKIGRLDGNFIEGMMCEGGCIGGPATMVPLMKSRVPLGRFSSEAAKKTVMGNDLLDDFTEVNLNRE